MFVITIASITLFFIGLSVWIRQRRPNTWEWDSQQDAITGGFACGLICGAVAAILIGAAAPRTTVDETYELVAVRAYDSAGIDANSLFVMTVHETERTVYRVMVKNQDGSVTLKEIPAERTTVNENDSLERDGRLVVRTTQPDRASMLHKFGVHIGRRHVDISYELNVPPGSVVTNLSEQ